MAGGSASPSPSSSSRSRSRSSSSASSSSTIGPSFSLISRMSAFLNSAKNVSLSTSGSSMTALFKDSWAASIMPGSAVVARSGPVRMERFEPRASFSLTKPVSPSVNTSSLRSGPMKLESSMAVRTSSNASPSSNPSLKTQANSSRARSSSLRAIESNTTLIFLSSPAGPRRCRAKRSRRYARRWVLISN